MCGIVGILSFSSRPETLNDPIRKMASALTHRGPDDEGFFLNANVALGNRRLSIIDLTGGKQPISTTDGRFTIVYNGEVFNYRELRKELAEQGQRFQTESDTEVVLTGFVRHGATFLDRLEGMFAFLIYDSQEKVLHAARDPFGIKPLYAKKEKGAWFISSEVRPLAAGGSFRLNRERVRWLFECGYVPGRETLFEGIFRVSPGSIFSISSDGNTREKQFSTRLEPEKLAAQKEIDVEQTIVRAVERSLVADVPIGLYLSGGIDSSLIASIVSRELGRKLQSFSVSFPGQSTHDEAPVAREVANVLGLEHESIAAKPEDFLDLNTLARTLEEPMADPSAVLLGRLSSFASGRLKVVLSGEGGDELFGGYHRYFWDRVVTRYRGMPAVLRKFSETVMGQLPSERLQRRVEKLRRSIDLDRPERYMSWFSPFKKDELDRLIRNESSAAKYFGDLLNQARPFSVVTQLQWLDLVTFLRDDLLAKADKMSMVHSLEVRVPFLQTDVVSAAFSLPERQRIQARQTKPFLRKMLRKYLPPSIVDRKKQGFEVPFRAWFRGPLRPVLDQYVSDNVVRERGLLDAETVRKIREEHDGGQCDRGTALFALALFEAWCQEFLD